MRCRGGFKGGASSRPGRLAALAVLALMLGACAAGMGSMSPGGSGGAQREALKIPVVLRSIPRHVQFAPQDEWVHLWDRPGGPSARAVRLARVPSGTEGLVVENEPPQPLTSDFWDWLGTENPRRQPVRWVKVLTPKGEGWVREEFIQPR